MHIAGTDEKKLNETDDDEDDGEKRFSFCISISNPDASKPAEAKQAGKMWL